jgi:hypothetical protein
VNEHRFYNTYPNVLKCYAHNVNILSNGETIDIVKIGDQLWICFIG